MLRRDGDEVTLRYPGYDPASLAATLIQHEAVGAPWTTGTYGSPVGGASYALAEWDWEVQPDRGPVPD